jgi:hypothetical protein
MRNIINFAGFTMLLCTISCKLLKELFSVVVEYATEIARCFSTIWKGQEISMLQEKIMCRYLLKEE